MQATRPAHSAKFSSPSQPRRGALCRRLYCRLKARYLRWHISAMRERRAKYAQELDTLVEAAIVMALNNQHSPMLTQRRRALRQAVDALTDELGVVCVELVELEKTL